jgi:L-aminoadipate-semialdehyde dehydrogenase
MPLNPNGKIDKPALPFPDTAQAASTAPLPDHTSSTEKTMQTIWASILPNVPQPIPVDESFFDLGGHSILATRLIFDIRKTFVVNAPLGLVFDQPTIKGLASAIDTLRNADLGLESNIEPSGQPTEKETLAEYGQDYLDLLPQLKQSYPPLSGNFSERPLTIFLTGATGFLGAFVLHNLLSRQTRVQKVICLVRAPSQDKALIRLKEGSVDRGIWNDDWVTSGRLEVLTGDLSLDLFGLGKIGWDRVAGEADVVLHNGALVNQLTLSQLFLTYTVVYRCTGYIPMKSFDHPTSWRRSPLSSLPRQANQNF